MTNTFKNYSLAGVTAEANVVTCPVGSIITVIGSTIANTSGTPTTVSIKINDVYLLKDALIESGSTLVPVGGDQKVVLTANDVLKVSADASVDVIVNALVQA
jgi:hypothetical protein